jgi:exo-beta-1,3-glucanase (GH17 family)
MTMKKVIGVALCLLLISPVLSLAASVDPSLIGINYKGFPTTEAEIKNDLAALSLHFTYIKTYLDLFAGNQLVVPTVAQYYPTMQVAIGLGLQKDNDSHSYPGSYYEIDQAIAQANAYPHNVNAIVVGGEGSLGYLGADKLVEYMTYIKARVPATVKVTTQQVWGDLLNGTVPSVGGQQLIGVADYLLATLYPYWDGYPGADPTIAGQAALTNWKTDFATNYGKLVAAYGAGKVLIGETGWPTDGSQTQNAGGNWTGIPSVANQKTYTLEYAAYAGDPSQSPPPFTYIFAGIDEPDKAPEPGGVQGHWGLYNVDDTPKWNLVGGPPPVPIPGTLGLTGAGLLAMLGAGRRFTARVRGGAAGKPDGTA